MHEQNPQNKYLVFNIVRFDWKSLKPDSWKHILYFLKLKIVEQTNFDILKLSLTQ